MQTSVINHGLLDARDFLERFGCGGDRLLNVVFRVRRRDERGFKLRRWEVNSLLEHRAEETGKGGGVCLPGRSVVNDGSPSEEWCEHRSHAVDRESHAGALRFGPEPCRQLLGERIEAVIGAGAAQKFERLWAA